MANAIITSVYGNLLRLRIPLTLRVINNEGETPVATDADFIPNAGYPVMVIFADGAKSHRYDAVMDGNVAGVEVKGDLPIGTWSLAILCRDEDGNPMRFAQSNVVKVVNYSAQAGLEPGIEFQGEIHVLDAAVYSVSGMIKGDPGEQGPAGPKGDKGDKGDTGEPGADGADGIDGRDGINGADGVGIDDISTTQSQEPGGANTITIELTDGRTKTFTVLNGSGSDGYEPPVGGIPKTDLAQSVQDTLDDVSNKVDKVAGKGLSTNDYTTAEKTKLAGLENYDDSALQTAVAGKVDKETGKSLMTDAERTKLAGIEAGAEVNVQANWTQTNTSADDYIKNKPTKVSDFTNDSGFTSNSGTITGITMNGASKGTSGVVDLGTVITAHQDISGKANSADVYPKSQTYTKSEVDTAVGNAGKVKSVTLNGTNHEPNSQGVVDLGTVQGETGPQGLTGNCNINDASQLITILVNNFTTGGAGNIASAETVKILRQNVDRVQANIQTLFNAIANFAFPQDKPQLTELDWNVPKNTVTINGVSNTVITRNGEPVSGSTLVDYGTELTLLISPAQGYAITSLTADNGVLTDNGNGTYTLVITVTNNITITFTGAASVAYSITYNLTNIQSASRPVSIISGGTASIALQPTSGYALTTNEITVVGATVVSYADNVLTISNPTGDVTVTAVAYDATNTAFKGVKYICQSSGNGSVEFGPQTGYITSPLIDVRGVSSVRFNCGASVDRTVGLFVFDANGNYIDYFMYNAVDRSVNISSLNVSYVRISVAQSSLSSAYVKNTGTGEYLWQGSSIADASVLPDYTAFEASPYCLQPNSNGDFIGMCYTGTANGKAIANPSKIFGLGYTHSYSMSKRVLLPSGSNSITFGTTGGSGDVSSYLAVYKSVGGAKDDYFDNKSANPRTMTLDCDKWVECQLIFKTAGYANATIYDNTHSTALWQPLSD